MLKTMTSTIYLIGDCSGVTGELHLDRYYALITHALLLVRSTQDYLLGGEGCVCGEGEGEAWPNGVTGDLDFDDRKKREKLGSAGVSLNKTKDVALSYWLCTLLSSYTLDVTEMFVCKHAVQPAQLLCKI